MAACRSEFGARRNHNDAAYLQARCSARHDDAMDRVDKRGNDENETRITSPRTGMNPATLRTDVPIRRRMSRMTMRALPDPPTGQPRLIGWAITPAPLLLTRNA
jgi:hypothetical protein